MKKFSIIIDVVMYIFFIILIATLNIQTTSFGLKLHMLSTSWGFVVMSVHLGLHQILSSLFIALTIYLISKIKKNNINEGNN